MDLDDPVAVALRVAEAFERAGIRYALYGGLMLAAYGEPRETRDADIVVLGSDPGPPRAALNVAGMPTLLAFENVLFGGLRLSRLTLLGAPDDTGLNTVDLVVPRSNAYAARVLERARRGPLRDRHITVVAPEDFVVLKVLSTRERDLDDAASVMVHSADIIEMDVVDAELTTLGAELPDVDVAGRRRALLDRVVPRPGGP